MKNKKNKIRKYLNIKVQTAHSHTVKNEVTNTYKKNNGQDLYIRSSQHKKVRNLNAYFKNCHQFIDGIISASLSH